MSYFILVSNFENELQLLIRSHYIKVMFGAFLGQGFKMDDLNGTHFANILFLSA